MHNNHSHRVTAHLQLYIIIIIIIIIIIWGRAGLAKKLSPDTVRLI
jgi:hypothetical protein